MKKIQAAEWWLDRLLALYLHPIELYPQSIPDPKAGLVIILTYRAVPAEWPSSSRRKDGICKDSTFCICALMLLLRRESCVDTWKCWKPIGQKKRIPCALANRLTPFLVTWYTITAHRAKSKKNSLCKSKEFPVLFGKHPRP